MQLAGLDKDSKDVAAMFDGVARRYDLTNSVLTGGLDRQWRRIMTQSLTIVPGQRVLDIAAGTGVSSVPLIAAGAQVISADFSVGMLQQGKATHSHCSFVAADATQLPFDDGVFDAVTMSFGLRNVQDVPAALREFARVTKPGGTVVICEFSQPVHPWWRAAYFGGALRVLPFVAEKVSSFPESYVYLCDTIRTWHSQRDLALLMGDCGWTDPHWRNLTGGIVAVHRAYKEDPNG